MMEVKVIQIGAVVLTVKVQLTRMMTNPSMLELITSEKLRKKVRNLSRSRLEKNIGRIVKKRTGKRSVKKMMVKVNGKLSKEELPFLQKSQKCLQKMLRSIFLLF